MKNQELREQELREQELREIIIKIKGEIPPSLNAYLGKSAPYKVYGEEKKKWARIIEFNSHSIPPKPFKKAEITIIYNFYKCMRRDIDNYSGKFLLDPLVSLGYIEDDSFKCIRLNLKAYFGTGENKGVDIVIKELAEDTILY